MYFTIEKASNDQYYFRIVSSGNHKTLCHSETYHNKADVKNAIGIIADGAAGAPVYDYT